MNSLRLFVLICFCTLLFSRCEDLQIENLNSPDLDGFYARPGKVEEIAGTLINNWFRITHGYSSLGMSLLSAADAGTGSLSWMITFGREPRTAFDNHPNANDCFNSENYYRTLYSVLATSNDILRLTETSGLETETVPTDMVRAVAWFAQGVSLGYLGLVYDKAFIVTHETDLQVNIGTSPYKDLVSQAVRSLDNAIAISKENTFTLPPDWLPGDFWSSQEFAQLASSFAARLLVYSARNKSDDHATDWARVYTYARNGIQRDFAPLADHENWWSDYHFYSVLPGGVQTDMYVIHLMDSGMPARWPLSGKYSDLPNNGRATSADARLESDFQYLSSCLFPPSRGYYLFSSYRYKRLDTYLNAHTGRCQNSGRLRMTIFWQKQP